MLSISVFCLSETCDVSRHINSVTKLRSGTVVNSKCQQYYKLVSELSKQRFVVTVILLINVKSLTDFTLDLKKKHKNKVDLKKKKFFFFFF